MDQLEIITGLIGLMFLAVIGVYAWTYTVSRDMNKQLGRIYETVNKHQLNTDVHVNKNDDFVETKLCNQIHTTVKEDLTEIKADVKCLLSFKA